MAEIGGWAQCEKIFLKFYYQYWLLKKKVQVTIKSAGFIILKTYLYFSKFINFITSVHQIGSKTALIETAFIGDFLYM